MFSDYLSVSYDYDLMEQSLRILELQIPEGSEFELLVFSIQNCCLCVLAIPPVTNDRDLTESNSGFRLTFMKLHRKLTKFAHVIFMITFWFYSTSTFTFLHALWSYMCWSTVVVWCRLFKDINVKNILVLICILFIKICE